MAESIEGDIRKPSYMKMRFSEIGDVFKASYRGLGWLLRGLTKVTRLRPSKVFLLALLGALLCIIGGGIL